MDKQSKSWYQNTVVIVALLVIFFPVGLFLMWKYANWSPKVKWIITGIFAVLLIQNQATNNRPVPVKSNNQIKSATPQQVSETKLSPSPEVKNLEKYNVVVASEIVKKVKGKYRYFFNIRNKDNKPFSGRVVINLYTESLSNPLASDGFDTQSPIEPNLGKSVYVDANTGPASEHGANGLVKFKYNVLISNQVVNSGEGEITNKFENTDAYPQ